MKIKDVVKLIRMSDIQDGVRIPLFYLPVRMHIEKYAIEAWIFPLAPFVLIYRVIVSVFWVVWADLNEFIGLNVLKYRTKKKN